MGLNYLPKSQFTSIRPRFEFRLIPELVCSSYVVLTANGVHNKRGTGQLNFDVVSWGGCCPADEGVCMKGRLRREKVDILCS